jgi:hypothetical protein
MTTTAENKNLEIICAGIIVADVFLPPMDRMPDEGELIEVDEPAHQVGGCASNTAIALSKLGKKTGIIGMVGSDAIGDQLIRLLINEKINTNAVFKTKEASTSQTIIVPIKNQDRRYIHYFGANSKISVSDLDNGLNGYLSPNNMKIFIFGGYLLMPSIDSKELAELFRKLKEKNYTILFSQYVKGKDSEDFDETARQIFGSAAWTTVIKEDRRKLQLTAGGGCHFCLELDDYGRCYLAATSKAYPTRYIFGTSTGDSTDRLFSCLRREVSNVDEWEEEMFPAGSIQGSRLKTSAKKFIKTYAAKFDDILSIDKVALVKRKVEDVKVTMGKNLDLALGERDALLEGLVEKSKKLETDAKLFSSNANAARRAACIRLYKSYVLIFLFVFLIILVIVLILNYSVFYWW